MLHRIVLSSFAMIILVMCQNQNSTANSIADEKTTKISDSAVTVSQPLPTKTSEKIPEMSDGMAPDKAAEKIAKQEQSSAMKNSSGIIYLKEGENKFLKEYEMNITFKGILEDSRCPKDVNCIWAGIAVADVEIMGLATRPMKIKLSTTDNTGKGLSKTQNFNGYNISLLEVSPETTSSKGFKALKGSYKIGLKFTKGNSQTQGAATTK